MGWCKHCAQNRQMEREPINGFLCCCSCGRVIDQDVFSTEVTFVKGAVGQSQMSGNYVRTVQGEHSESHERTLNKGRDEISDMVEQAAKEAAAAAAKELQESDLQNCSEELLNARQLAAAAAVAVEKSKKERKQKREANAKNGTPAQTAAEATREMLTKKRLSSKINYEVLEKLFDDSTAPENSKKKRVESDDENDDYGQQISEESGEKVVSDVVDNNDDFREDDYEEGDGDGLYYGNEEDGYGYDDEY